MATLSASPLGSLHLPANHFSPSDLRKKQFGSHRQNRLTPRGTKRQGIRLLAKLNASQRNRSSKKEVIMVDPLEAKRLAAEEKEEIETKQRLKRRRQIEAINGAWAMIGLTAGLVIEGHTGKSILAQLAGYSSAIISIFER
ncbi:unnamed protein product [Cuscuta campestris]|uniref:Uncharacterized protein n=1 Tax=Cuscuta campestris TaxID=132261 RepID=A0A484MHM1_9ASTE|nr:unnamed protein product [Cuscuta campestris]